jgi:hypothetical protein
MAASEYKLRVDFSLSKEEMTRIAWYAYAWGYKKEDLRKPWSIRELKKAVRYVLEQQMKSYGAP